MFGASEDCSRTDSASVKEYYGARSFSQEGEERAMGREFWTNGYYVATVGERGNWQVVENYVKNQGKPKEELRQLKLF